MSNPREDQAEDDNRTTPTAFFNVAESYWQAALALEKANLRTTHPGSPISFLYYHAIELYLKAFLRMHGHTAKELRAKFGHHSGRLAKRAQDLGLSFDDEDTTVLSMMATTDAVIRSRYTETGFFRWPAREALDRTCRSLRAAIGAALVDDGFPVRL